ncbi:MAG: PEGA domain-containing protein [Candidatus Cloacimonetes bacterium]|nr:PEGA domain-containing protein [Candidatus Cloacimonadota bacterium]
MKQLQKIGLVFCFFSIIIIAVNGCAIIFQGTSKSMSFDSGPGAAEVWINGSKAGVTPCKIELKRDQEYSVEFRKEGFETKSYRITNSVGAGWVILDILGGLVPLVIDAATGAWYSFDQENINALLEEQQ